MQSRELTCISDADGRVDVISVLPSYGDGSGRCKVSNIRSWFQMAGFFVLFQRLIQTVQLKD
jgi:hypothetical protein